MNKKYFLLVSTIVLLISIILPSISLAATIIDTPYGSGSGQAADPSGCTGKPKDIGALFGFALCTLNNSVIPFLVGLAVIVLMVGIVQYVRAGDDEEKRSSGRNLMLFGIIALFVMVSVWGFVKILHTTFFGGNFEIGSIPPISKQPFK